MEYILPFVLGFMIGLGLIGFIHSLRLKREVVENEAEIARVHKDFLLEQAAVSKTFRTACRDFAEEKGKVRKAFKDVEENFKEFNEDAHSHLRNLESKMTIIAKAVAILVDHEKNGCPKKKERGSKRGSK